MENNNVSDFLEGVVASEIANWALFAPSSSRSSDESDCSDSFLLESDYNSDYFGYHCMPSDNESGDALLRYAHAMFEKNVKPKITSYFQDLVHRYTDEDVSMTKKVKWFFWLFIINLSTNNYILYPV